MSKRASRWLLLPAAVLTGLAALLGAPAAASAHGFSSVVLIDLGTDDAGDLQAELRLEYDLLVVSAADAEEDDPLFRAGTDAFDAGDPEAEVVALEDHLDSVLAYVDERFTVATPSGQVCHTEVAEPISMTEEEGAPYAVLTLDLSCAQDGDGHVIRSDLFPDSEQYVTGTKTIVSYDIDGRTGSASLDAAQPSFSTEQSFFERFWEFFHLGAEHLLTGIDHILFLLALIAGSRRLREVVLAATAFTIAHSVTFILAATGVVTVPAAIIEPIIAISISIVAAWYLWRLWRRGAAATELDSTSGPLGLDRAGWLRLLVVFAFGLVHGLGFASALGIDQPWSWTLLWSLLVFNVGIEVVQLTIIAIVFPLLVLLRRRAPKLGLWATGALAVSVTVAGLIWFVQRILGIG
ncbi:HupE/UreJ family protein [Herbiconiux sp. UC225_62]|uniref:HupE/UreJ family protein n=1 Tax=Herbiconiux sp. UC225_62 TaxID=3350168 RepID=UPI0036D2825B